MRKRLLFLGVCVCLIFGALLTRLVFIQIIDTQKYASVTATQQRIRLDGTNNRGAIYDRNRVPITGDAQEYVYIIPKNKMDSKVESIFQSINGRKVVNQNNRYVVYSSETFSNDVAYVLKRDYSAFMIKAERRYAKNQPAVHMIGYINEIDGKGACGLEKDYNDDLSKKQKIVYASADARGMIIPGQGITTKEENSDSGIVTTLDISIQKKVEDVLESSGYHGAIVVLDSMSGDILASASAPSYNPYDVKNYLNSANREFINKATQSMYPPGSTFKIIVAAAALEKGIVTPDTKFVCKGYEDINGVRIKCSKEEGHGEITFREAFAKSCNSAFIQLGAKTGAEDILRMAKKFGLGDKVIPGISSESKGNLSTLWDSQGAGIGNLSIGQGTLLATPVQIAKVTNIIANGGLDKGVNLMKGVTSDGISKEIKTSEPTRIISENTCNTIRDLMAEVVNSGTANNLDVRYYNLKSGSKKGEKIKIAGKTGSAQANDKGNEIVHGWFTGFLPVDNPKYVITVFVENGGSGRGAAIPLFQRVAQSLYN